MKNTIKDLESELNNPFKLEVGQRVRVDKGKPNSSEVIIQSFTPSKMFATVKADDGYEWQTMTHRLSKLESKDK